MQAHIYIEVDNANSKETDKRYAYVLAVEDRIETAAGTGALTGTYNRAVLTAVARALGRLTHPYEVYIHTNNTIAISMLRNLEKWAQDDFKRKTGEPIANRAELSYIWEHGQECSFYAAPGPHSYQEWLRWEINKRKPA